MRLTRPAAAILVAMLATTAFAEDAPMFKLVARDGKFEPATLEVPAGKRVRVEVSNQNAKAIEFESKDLKQEKVIAKGAKSSIVVNGLKPGTYVFFDEHKPDAPKGKIVAK